jgi:hypothetical protein
MSPTKDEVARELAAWHFRVEPDLKAVFVLRSEAHEPIRLLEVNAATVTTGSVEPFAFAPTKETPFATVVAEITPEEFERVRRDEIKLPSGWSLTNALELNRTNAA